MNRGYRIFFWVLAATSGTGIAISALDQGSAPVVASHGWGDQSHHTSTGFQNVWGPYQEPSGWQTAGWLLGSAWRSADHKPTPFERIDPDAAAKHYSRYRAFWLGHATVLIQSGGKNILTDPIFASRASPFAFAGPRRQVGVPLALRDLPPIHVVLLSHNHFDHTNEAALRELDRAFRPLFLVPLGQAELLRDWGLANVRELDWWQYVDFAGHRFTATPVQHFSSRSLTDHNKDLWAGWFFRSDDGKSSFYFAGDTGYGPFFRETRQRLGAPDLALLPIGAYEPRWFMQIVHVDPQEALQAYRDLGARTLLPIHWGTYDLADEPLDLPIEALRAVATGDKGVLLDLPVGGQIER